MSDYYIERLAWTGNGCDRVNNVLRGNHHSTYLTKLYFDDSVSPFLNIFNLMEIDAFKLWCWRRLLRVPWTARKSKQSILKEISPEYSLEYWNILKYIGIY